MRRCDQFPRGHRSTFRPDSARKRNHIDEHQFARGSNLGNVPRRRGKTRSGLEEISGTLQNDILKEYIAQKEYIYPPEPSMRLVIDTFEFAVKNTPKFNTISISGYHIREAGSTAIQELAFTLRDGLEYVEWGMHRG